METFDTIYMTDSKGVTLWLSPESSKSFSADAYGAASFETRKVLRASVGKVLKLGEDLLGDQIWLKDGTLPDGIEEVEPPKQAEADPEDQRLILSDDDDDVVLTVE